MHALYLAGSGLDSQTRATALRRTVNPKLCTCTDTSPRIAQRCSSNRMIYIFDTSLDTLHSFYLTTREKQLLSTQNLIEIQFSLRKKETTGRKIRTSTKSFQNSDLISKIYTIFTFLPKSFFRINKMLNPTLSKRRKEERQADTHLILALWKKGLSNDGSTRAICYGGRSSSWRISNSRSAQSATIIAFHDMPNQWNTCPASRKASTEHPDAVDPLCYLLAASLRFAPSSCFQPPPFG